MGLQIPAGGLVMPFGEDGAPTDLQVKEVRVRMDLWPTWLEIGCLHAEQARMAAQRLSARLPDSEKAIALTAELQNGLVALTAFAFAVDGFYDTLRNEWGRHPDEPAWKRGRTSRAAQVCETFRYHLKLGPQFSAQVRQVIDELFKFRGRAVHPDSKWVDAIHRPGIDSGVHPHLITFSGPHAVQCRAMMLVLLDRLVVRATELTKADCDNGWLERGREELDRLSASYRVPGDDQVAFATARARTDQGKD